MIAILGSTGTGKSTLISYLKGDKLKFKKFGGGKFEIDHIDKGN